MIPIIACVVFLLVWYCVLVPIPMFVFAESAADRKFAWEYLRAAWFVAAMVGVTVLAIVLSGCAAREPVTSTPIYEPPGAHTTDQMIDAVNAWELTPEGRQKLGKDAGKP